MPAKNAHTARPRSESSAGHALWTGLARAVGGAVFFSMPLLMTMEMWWLGFYMDRFRLALFLVWMIPILIVLDHYSGFEPTSSWTEDAVDGMIAYGIGFVTSALALFLFNVLDPSMSFREILGKISVQAVPASFGAVLATSQLGMHAGANGSPVDGTDEESEGEEAERQKEERKSRVGYAGEIFFMLVGSIFLAFNVAPTEEMIVISFKMTEWHALSLAVVSIAMMHAFVYAVDFKGSPSAPEGTPWWSLFLRFTVVGYAIALLVSAYVLWTFGRYEGTAWATQLQMAIVLAFPASLGAAAARLLL